MQNSSASTPGSRSFNCVSSRGKRPRGKCSTHTAPIIRAAASTPASAAASSTKSTKAETRVAPKQRHAELGNEDLLLDFVQCTLEPSQSFNLPRISASLERLIGTNVVRLTDRKFMKDLRMSLDADYRNQLEKRIKTRELKEIERERLLIIEGKTDIIPQELADDPIFVVNKIANIEIQKQRSKLKTNRERNAERLKVQGVKWERERLKHKEEENARLEVVRERYKQQKQLEQQYLEEDAVRAMDLLRIDNEDWRECEQELKQFLDDERAKMKERSMRVPTPYTSDRRDILNIVRARQKFRETEQKIRQQLEDQKKTKDSSPKDFAAKSAASKISKLVSEIVEDAEEAPEPIQTLNSRELLQIQMEKEEHLRRKYMDDASDMSSEPELQEDGSTISESKRRHATNLQQDLEHDVERGYLISKEQYEQLRYTDGKIMQLRQAQDVRELYQLAEEIIIGDRIEEEVVEEEMGEEEEELPPPEEEET